MSLRTSIVVKKDPTAATLTGGTDRTFINDGRGTGGANVLVDSSNGNLLTREQIITRITQPQAAPNANAMAKLGHANVVTHHPFVDSNNKSYRCPAQTDISYHPEMTEAQRLAVFMNHISVLVDAELTNFFSKSVND